LADLDEVLTYLDGYSPRGAERVKAKIQAAVQLLSRHPFAGTRTRLPWLRRMRVAPYPYLIFYEVDDEQVIVHAVRHAARHPSTMPDAV